MTRLLNIPRFGLMQSDLSDWLQGTLCIVTRPPIMGLEISDRDVTLEVSLPPYV